MLDEMFLYNQVCENDKARSIVGGLSENELLDPFNLAPSSRLIIARMQL